MKRDEWITTALGDEAVVAEFLLRLRHSAAAAAPQTAAMGWGRRQARSKKERDSMRFSPTTPLSWSYAAASEDSSRPSDLSSGSRSKGTYTNDSIACSWGNKRSKRKKSITELQEEETLLLKEGTHLKTESDTLHLTLKKQKVKSENLNRLKTDLQQPAFGVASKPYHADGLNTRQANDANGSRTDDYIQASNDIDMHKDHVVTVTATATAVKAERSFFLPDLNMPFEDDSTFDSFNCFS